VPNIACGCSDEVAFESHCGWTILFWPAEKDIVMAIRWRRHSIRAGLRVAAICSILLAAILANAPASAQFVCSTTPADITCTNPGAVAGGFTNTANGANQNASTVNSGSDAQYVTSITNGGGNATLINSGGIGQDASANATGSGSATLINSGSVGTYAAAVVLGNGDATLTNSGSIGQLAAANTFGSGSATVINSGSIGQQAAAIAHASGNATVINSGSIGQYAKANADAGGNAMLINSGSIGTYAEAVATGNGNAALTNSGTVSDFVVASTSGSGNATLTNSGSIARYAQVNTSGSGNATLTNSGSIGQYAFVSIGAGGNGTIINSGTIGEYAYVNGNAGGHVMMVNSGTVNKGVLLAAFGGSSSLINSGIILSGPTYAVMFFRGSDTLTLLPGSFIVGAIDLVGANDTVNVNAHNQNLTFNTLAGATVTGTVPYVVSGNRIVSLDPTGFGTGQRNLTAVTGAVSGMIAGRTSDAAAGNGGALGFAGASAAASSVDDAFAQVMGYAPASNDAVVFKNPTMTLNDGTTVWARGFYGLRTQQADGPALRNVTNFYGGAIGIDAPVRPDLRLGGLVGGGATSTSIDLNSGSARSDIGFGGFYGRKDIGDIFVDFALLGGATGNHTTRNINNNQAANGFEIASASFGGWFISPEIATGHRYDVGSGWSVTPTARLRYLAAGFGGYTETGSTANLAVGGRILQNIEERGDLTLTHVTNFTNADRLSTSTYAGVLGQQRIGDGGVNAILLGQALAFATPGKSNIGGGYAGFGLEWRTAKGVSMFASAEYTAMTDASNTVTGRAGLRVGF
jgi:hypothetical protein